MTALVSVLRGLVRLARFDPAGFGYLGGGAQDVLASLSPPLACLLVVTLLGLLDGAAIQALAGFAAALALLLLPLVASERLARRWGRDAQWGRFAAALNWSQWTVGVVFVLSTGAAGVLVSAGFPARPTSLVAAMVVLAYALALHWFLARRGLEVSAGRACLVLLVVDMLPALLLVAFLWLEVLQYGPPPKGTF